MEIYDRWRKKRNNEEGWRMDSMKTFLVICLVAIIIVGLYYLVKSLVIVGLLTVIGIGLYFWISKKLKNWMNEHTLVRIFEPLDRKKKSLHARTRAKLLCHCAWSDGLRPQGATQEATHQFEDMPPFRTNWFFRVSRQYQRSYFLCPTLSSLVMSSLLQRLPCRYSGTS